MSIEILVQNCGELKKKKRERSCDKTENEMTQFFHPAASPFYFNICSGLEHRHNNRIVHER